MEDLIERQAVLELLNEDDPRLLLRADYRKMIEDLPSVTQKTGWIPLSWKTEPKAYEHYLFTTDDGKVVLSHWDGRFSRYTAYMPLPEPYKGVEE